MAKLSEVPVFAKLFESSPAKKFEAKNIIIYEDDEVAQLYYIRQGFAKVYTITDEGDERVLLILQPGDIFPIIRDPEHHTHKSLYFYESMVEMDTCVVDLMELLDATRHDRAASWGMLRYSSELTSDLTNRITSLESKSVEDKIKKLLAYLIAVCGRQISEGTYLLGLRLTHLDIANLVGHTRESVSVMMKNLKKEGIVSYRRGYLLVKLPAES